MMGVTPGKDSMARKGSPKAPGRTRTSARPMVVMPKGRRSPMARISMGAWVIGVTVVPPEVLGVWEPGDDSGEVSGRG